MTHDPIRDTEHALARGIASKLAIADTFAESQPDVMLASAQGDLAS